MIEVITFYIKYSDYLYIRYVIKRCFHVEIFEKDVEEIEFMRKNVFIVLLFFNFNYDKILYLKAESLLSI